MPKFAKGLSIKHVRSQGEGGCPIRTFYGQGGMGRWMSALLGAKQLHFLNLWCVCTDRGEGLNQCGHFEDKEEGQFFMILCGSLLWTAPNNFVPNLTTVQLSRIWPQCRADK